jgi:hypothetical protein
MSSLVGLAKKNLPMLAVLAVIAAAVVLVLAGGVAAPSSSVLPSSSELPLGGSFPRIVWGCSRCAEGSSTLRRWV